MLGHKKTVEFFCSAIWKPDFAACFNHAANQIGAKRCLHLQKNVKRHFFTEAFSQLKISFHATLFVKDDELYPRQVTNQSMFYPTDDP